ncbi:MAG: FMN-binding protein [Acidimicrobiia bacterium]|nr:FMN-binding protein [Acidimicrobiia bacterium]
MTVATVPPQSTDSHNDPALGERMEQLARRSEAAKQAALNGATGSEGASVVPAGRIQPAKRKHAAGAARHLCLALSLLTTVVLTLTFSILSLPAIDQFALVTLPDLPATATGAASPSTIVTAPTQTTIVAAPIQTTVVAPIQTTFDGDLVSTRWGSLQVQAEFKNGVLEDVITLAHPDGDRTSVSINQQVLPVLRARVLTAQSADVDTISGASITSRAYKTSLQSAIDAARSAGATNL